jgi:hypothetical protein
MVCCVVWAISVFHQVGWAISGRGKMTWESHYSRVAGHFDVEKTVTML